MSTQAKSSTKKTTPRAARGTAKKPGKSFLLMAQEAINAGEDAKKGISRAAIKKFITAKYNIDFKDRVKVSALNRAITKGLADKQLKNGRTSGTFRLGDKAADQPPKKARKPRTPKEPKEPKAKVAREPKAKVAKPAREAKPKTVKKQAKHKKAAKEQ